MKTRLDVIVRFAELEAFVDQQVKTYSTGMLMRLAFASAIHVDPDLLIVDEALSVGDVYFQRKSLDRMDHFRQSGKTILFVSHDPHLIQRFCTRALWLEAGHVAMTGEAREVVTAYQAFCARLEDERLKDAAVHGGIRSPEHEEILRDLQLTGSRWGNGRIRFTHVEMINAAGEVSWVHTTGDPATIRFHVSAEEDFPRPESSPSIFIATTGSSSARSIISTRTTPTCRSRAVNTSSNYNPAPRTAAQRLLPFAQSPIPKTARPTGTIRRTFIIKCINSTSSPIASSTGLFSSKPSGGRSIKVRQRLRSQPDGGSLR
jgi:hypothetical protein